MDTILVPSEANTSWRFASIASAIHFFFNEQQQLRCQARAKYTSTKTCSRALIKNRESIMALLQFSHSIVVPSKDFGIFVLALSEISLCHGKGHKGVAKINEVRVDWCRKLRASCATESREGRSQVFECRALWDQHGSPSCWLAGVPDQNTLLDLSLNFRTLQLHEPGLHAAVQEEPSKQDARLLPLSAPGEQSRQAVNPSMPPSNRAHVEPESSDSQVAIKLSLRSKSDTLGLDAATAQVQLLDTRVTLEPSTPTKRTSRPELHRSDIRTITPEIPGLYDNPWIDDSEAMHGATSCPSSPTVTSTPLSAFSTTSSTFDEPSAYADVQDTPPTELIETSRLWDRSSLSQFRDAESPSTKPWKSSNHSFSWQHDDSVEILSATEVALEEDDELEEICNREDVNEKNNTTKRRLFPNADRENITNIFPNEQHPFGPVKRAQTLPIRAPKDHEHEWSTGFPLRRHSIHEYSSQSVLGAIVTSDWKSYQTVRQRQRRDSLPFDITEHDLLEERDDPDVGLKTRPVVTKTHEAFDPDDDYEGEDPEVELQSGRPSKSLATETGSLLQEIIPLPPATFEPFKQPKDSLRELQIKIRQSIDTEALRRPGYVYCYERADRPGYLKIGHVRITEEQYEKDLTTGSAYFPRSTNIDADTESPMTPPRSVLARMRKWKSKCKYEPLVVYWSPAAYSSFRIEKLVHQHLVAHRKREAQCDGCQKGHIEWFELDLQEAKEAIDLWCEFAKVKPYVAGCPWPLWAIRTLSSTDPESGKTISTVSEFLGYMRVWIGIQ